MLVISQTQAEHREIEELLENLRAASPGARLLPSASLGSAGPQALNELLSSKSDGGIDRKRWKRWLLKPKDTSAAITCFNGQTVHMLPDAAARRGRRDPGRGSGAAYQRSSATSSGAVLASDSATPAQHPTACLTYAVRHPRRGPGRDDRFLATNPPTPRTMAKASRPRREPYHHYLGPGQTSRRATGHHAKVPLGEPTLVAG